MKSIADALTIRRRVFGAFEMAESATSHDEARRWLTFALVGGGPTGVELAGQIRELATRTLRAEFRKILPQDARVLLFDGGKAPLASFGPALSAKAAAALRKLGVEQHMESLVTKVDLTGLEVRGPDGKTTTYEAGTVLWTAGVEAPPLATVIATATGAQQDRCGRIMVQPDLTIPGHPEISVTGDMMNRDGLPGVAEVAMQAGLYAARRIKHELAGQPSGQPVRKPFRYRDLGSAAYVSRGNAVVSVGRLHLDGFLGWWAWLVIHIGFMTGFRNRFGAVASWWFAFTRDLRRERTFTSRDVGVVRDVYGTDVADFVSATKTTGPPAPPGPAGSAAPGKPAPGRP
jgi:NADH dehydrogenase